MPWAGIGQTIPYLEGTLRLLLYCFNNSDAIITAKIITVIIFNNNDDNSGSIIFLLSIVNITTIIQNVTWVRYRQDKIYSLHD